MHTVDTRAVQATAVGPEMELSMLACWIDAAPTIRLVPFTSAIGAAVDSMP